MFLHSGEVMGVFGWAWSVAMGIDQELSQMAQLEKSAHLYSSSSSGVYLFLLSLSALPFAGCGTKRA